MQKFKTLALASAATMFSLALLSAADERDRDKIDRDQSPLTQTRASSGRQEFESRNLIKAKDFLGMEVRNQQDEKLGEIKDVVVNLPDGRVEYAVLSSADVFGSRDQLGAVPPGALSRSSDEKHLVLNMDREKLKAAPTFEMNSWPDATDRTWGSRVYSYYGIPPYWEAPGYTGSARGGAIDLARDTARTAGQDRVLDRTTDVTQYGAGRGAESDRLNRDRLENRDRPATVDRTLPADQTVTRDTLHSMGKANKASEILGMRVENPQNERLGDIQDLVLDLQSGRILYAVLASGGFLGIGEKYFAIPATAFQTAGNEKSLVLNVDKDRLKGGPAFEKNNWPTMADQTWGREVYTYYGQEPYWETDRSFGSTSRDRNRDSSPTDRDNDQSVTQQIRRAINSDQSFSSDAKNIRIQSDNGTVTLRGVVNSEQEKDQLEAKAKQVAGVTRVENKLEVRK